MTSPDKKNTITINEDEAKIAVAYLEDNELASLLEEQIKRTKIMRSTFIEALSSSEITDKTIEEIDADLRDRAPDLYEYTLPAQLRGSLIVAFVKGVDRLVQPLPPIIEDMGLAQVRGIAAAALRDIKA